MAKDAIPDWIIQAQELLELTQEAQPFVERAMENFPRALPTDSLPVARLWRHANVVDTQLYPLLESMNKYLLNGEGELDFTRGASTRPLMASVVPDELLFYECTWSLAWNKGALGLTVQVSIEPQMESFQAHVGSFTSLKSLDVRFPLQDEQLKDALMKAYIMEILG